MPVVKPISGRMPQKPKGRKSATKQARARKVAQGVVAGQSQAKIAAHLGVSAKTVQRDLATGPVQAVIISLVNRYDHLIERQFQRAMAAIDDAFEAVSCQVVRTRKKEQEGSPGIDTYEVVELGPDHYARLAAVKRHLEIVTAGRQAVKPEDRPAEGHSLVTIAVLQDLARQAKEHGQTH